MTVFAGKFVHVRYSFIQFAHDMLTYLISFCWPLNFLMCVSGSTWNYSFNGHFRANRTKSFCLLLSCRLNYWNNKHLFIVFISFPFFCWFCCWIVTISKACNLWQNYMQQCKNFIINENIVILCCKMLFNLIYILLYCQIVQYRN